ncbi:GNAT family N-acetyltransferase [Filimonas effusa]|uniref:GNAT family N-acetyltransferase n=1 Tax=Filimonas effusa TaxID=2508721 RepID=A0A4Q1DBQ5_9BACT|nr:GNAT family N-acetyltransferase [Filimonas effusa]RXK86914.1 GNAT family N-acetyltransferase [Filimonas effusa]
MNQVSRTLLSLHYRSALTTDRQALKALAWLSYSEYTQYMTPEDAVKLKTNMHSDAVWDSILSVAQGFVCTCEDKIVGMSFLVPSGNAWDIFQAEWSYIRMVGVDPDLKGYGIASRLMQQCIAHARSTNETIVALHTSEKMNAARHIYEKQGFKVLKEIAPRLGIRYWLYTMQL